MWIFINNLQLYTWVYITFIIRNLLLQNYLSYLLDILAVKKWKTEKYNTQCFLYIPSLPSLFSKIYSCKRKATRSRNARDSRSGWKHRCRIYSEFSIFAMLSGYHAISPPSARRLYRQSRERTATHTCAAT